MPDTRQDADLRIRTLADCPDVPHWSTDQKVSSPGRRAINVPLTLVTGGMSRSLAARLPRSSAGICWPITAICKLVISVLLAAR